MSIGNTPPARVLIEMEVHKPGQEPRRVFFGAELPEFRLEIETESRYDPWDGRDHPTGWYNLRLTGSTLEWKIVDPEDFVRRGVPEVEAPKPKIKEGPKLLKP